MGKFTAICVRQNPPIEFIFYILLEIRIKFNSQIYKYIYFKSINQFELPDPILYRFIFTALKE